MNRNLILMLAFGVMCVAVGAATRRLEAAGKCQDLAVAGGACPTQTGDDPNVSLCEDYNNAPQLCTKTGPHPVTQRQPNTSSFTKVVGSYPELQTGTGYPPAPLTTTCYFRRFCVYDSNKGICNSVDTERIIQDWYVTKPCVP